MTIKALINNMRSIMRTNETQMIHAKRTKNGLKTTSNPRVKSFTAMRPTKISLTAGQMKSVKMNGKVPSNPKMKKSGCRTKAIVTAQVPMKPQNCADRKVRELQRRRCELLNTCTLARLGEHLKSNEITCSSRVYSSSIEGVSEINRMRERIPKASH